MASGELFEDPFDPDEYVERLAWRTRGGGTKGGAQGFNPQVHTQKCLLLFCNISDGFYFICMLMPRPIAFFPLRNHWSFFA